MPPPPDFLSNRPSQSAKVLQERPLHQGRWSELVEVEYADTSGKTRRWECVHRSKRSEAVIIIAQLQPSGRYVLIRQFRPPAGRYVLEFPAGLVDAGETYEQTAIRELREETGYVGFVERVSPALYSSPGLISEACAYVWMSVTERTPENQNPQHDREPTEDIEVYLVALEAAPGFLATKSAEGMGLDLKLYAFFHALGSSRE
ncbi:MAG: hydrolase [Deltaproteobacteria bacterium]|jgi:ADP-ribose pyrophosphatase|nr:hydrolase [Deltaproteobacteria bacterium]MDP7318915.1 NUDIX hydrolase [SAR324 cluster bacterium]